MEIKLKVNKRTKAGKAFLAMLEIFLKDTKGVEIVKSSYDPEFVEMVKKSASSKKRYKVDNVDELWENL